MRDIEAALESHVATLILPTGFAQSMKEHTRAALEGESRLVNSTRGQLVAQLQKLTVEESRLLDLAADASVSSPMLKERLRQLHIRRDSIEAQIREVGPVMAEGLNRLDGYLGLMTDPCASYRRAPQRVKRQILEGFFHQIRLDDTITSGPGSHEFADAVQQILSIARESEDTEVAKQTRPGDAGASQVTGIGLLDGQANDTGSSKTVLVPLEGLEPPTVSLGRNCSSIELQRLARQCYRCSRPRVHIARVLGLRVVRSSS